jgi:hypothetical protein
VARDLFAAGGRVGVAADGVVGGDAWLAAGQVEVEGRVRGTLRAAGGRIRIAGQVDGDVHAAAPTVEILPTARIAGRLVYRSPDPARIDPGASIGGGVTHRPVSVRGNLARLARIAAWTFGVAVALAFVAIGLALLLVFPEVMRAAGVAILGEPARSLGLGLLVLIVTPPLAVLLVVTLLGLPLGMLLLACYLVWLLAGFLTGVICLGDLGLRLVARSSGPWRVIFFLLALAAVVLAQAVPVMGPLVLLAVLVFGTGGWTLHLLHRHRAHTY